MSLLDTLKDKLKPAKPLGPQLREALATAEAELARLESQRGTYALALAQGEPDAETSMAAWRRNVADQKQAVDDLRAAKQAADGKDRAAELGRIAAVRQSQIANVKHLLGDQAKAIAKLGAACENISDAWNDVIELAMQIQQALDQAGMPPNELAPWCGLVRPDRLRALVSIELWRTNRTKATDGGTYRWGLFGVNEAERFRAQFAVEGMTDLWQQTIHDPPFDMKNVKSLTERLADQRNELLRICQAQPLPAHEALAKEHVALSPPEQVLDQPPELPPLPQQRYFVPETGPYAGMTERPRSEGGGIPPVPDDVVLPADARDQALLEHLNQAAAKAKQSSAGVQ